MATAYELIDRGDNCSDPPESVGSYDLLDDFVDDGSQPGSPGQHLALRALFSPTPSQRSELVTVSPSSNLFVTPGPDEGRAHSYLGGSPGGTAIGSPFSTDTPIRARLHGRRGRERSSPYSSSPRRRPPQQRRAADPTAEEYDPFKIPAHLDIEQLPGLGVAGKRLGSGKARWACRYYLLTYAQAGNDWPATQLTELLDLMGAKCRLGKEYHRDGGTHYHAFVDFGSVYDFENPHRFCVGTKRPDSTKKCPGQAHCNILTIRRTPFRAFDYAGKDGNVLFENVTRPPARGAGASRDDKWAGSLQLESKDEFLADLKNHSPRDWVLYAKQIQATAERMFGKRTAEPNVPDESMGLTVHWERYPEIKHWILCNLRSPISILERLGYYPASTGFNAAESDEHRLDRELVERRGDNPARPKSLVIFGESRMGKTIFAKALGRCIYFRRHFNMKKLFSVGVENIDYTLWDDVPWTEKALKNDGFKAWLGGEDEFEVFDRYQETETIRNFSKPAVFLSNKDPGASLSGDDYLWLRENATIVQLGSRDAVRSNALASATRFETENL